MSSRPAILKSSKPVVAVVAVVVAVVDGADTATVKLQVLNPKRE